MFKVFKKKPKTGGGAPTISPPLAPGSLTVERSSTNKTKTLFSLHKRKSASAVALDHEGPVQLLDLQAPLRFGDEEETPNTQTSHSARRLDFRSFHGDSRLHSSHYGDTDAAGSESESSVASGHISFPTKPPVSAIQEMWQTPTPPPEPVDSASQFLEQIQTESRLRTSTSTQFLSTFRNPNNGQMLDKVLSESSPVLTDVGATEEIGDISLAPSEVYPVPEEFQSLNQHQSAETPFILPPQGFCNEEPRKVYDTKEEIEEPVLEYFEQDTVDKGSSHSDHESDNDRHQVISDLHDKPKIRPKPALRKSLSKPDLPNKPAHLSGRGKLQTSERTISLDSEVCSNNSRHTLSLSSNSEEHKSLQSDIQPQEETQINKALSETSSSHVALKPVPPQRRLHTVFRTDNITSDSGCSSLVSEGTPAWAQGDENDNRQCDNIKPTKQCHSDLEELQAEPNCDNIKSSTSSVSDTQTYDSLNPLEHLLKYKRSSKSSGHHVETSSHISRDTTDFEITSVSTIDESQQYMLSDSFLDDTNTNVWDENVTEDLHRPDQAESVSHPAVHRVQLSHITEQSPPGSHGNNTTNILISDSFLNDTITPMINTSTPGNGGTNGDNMVIIEEDYIPGTGTQLPNKQEQWQDSMAMVWQRSRNDVDNINGNDTDSGENSSSIVTDISESEVTTEENFDVEDVKTNLITESRWQLKPVSLWTTEDVCNWLETRNLSSLLDTIRARNISGQQIIQSPVAELGELTTNENIRQKLLHDVQTLREPHSNTGTNEPVMSERLRNLSWLNQQQQSTIGQYLNQLEKEQTDAQKLLAKYSSQSPHRFKTEPIMKWTTGDVVAWLESVGMEKFGPMFAAHQITGIDLMAIDMELLDTVGISSIQDRELILSRLYELQPATPGGSKNTSRIHEIFQQPVTSSDIIPPPSDISSSPSEIISETSTTPTAKQSRSSSKKSSRRLFHDEESKIALGHLNKMERKLSVWHDLSGLPVSLELLSSPDVTAGDIIQRVLQEAKVTDNSSNFYLTTVTMDTKTNLIYTKTLGRLDRPHEQQKVWSNSPNKRSRFEIRRKTKTKTKIIFNVDNEISTSKMLDTSSMCTCGELQQMALSMFGLDDPSGAIYHLQAVGDNGVPQSVSHTKLISVYHTNIFLLNEKLNSEVIEAEEVIQHSTDGQLQGALNTKLSSKKYIAEKQKYEANISELREGLREKDKIVSRLQLENEQLLKESKKLDDLESVFAGLEKDNARRQNQLRLKFSQLEADLKNIRSASQEKPPYDEEVDTLEQALIVTGQQIQLVEQQDSLLKSQLSTAQKGSRPEAEVVRRLKQLLSENDISLMNLKQQQADTFKQLRLAQKQLLKQQRNLFEAERFSTYKLLEELGHNPSVLHQVLPISLPPPEIRAGFIISSDHSGRPVVKHVEEGSSLFKGDRILEANGAAVTHLTDMELSKVLQKTMCNIVVLRKTQNYELRVQEKIEEVESVREDLSMAIVELETAQEEARELTEQINRIKMSENLLKQELQDNKKLYQRMREEKDWEISGKDKELSAVRDQLLQKKQEISSLNEDLSGLRDELAKSHNELQVAKNSKPLLRVVSRGPSLRSSHGLQRESVHSNQRDSGIRTMTEVDSRAGTDWTHTTLSEDTEEGEIVIAYEKFDLVPLWENMQHSPKSEVLQALKDQVLENHQQKVYLDRLLTVVIDHAPNLVQTVDASMGVQDHSTLALKARTEEFC